MGSDLQASPLTAARQETPAPALAWAPLFAALACALLFWFFGSAGLNMADESFLWYGVKATVAGAVPLRDFQSYDPGRYYWCAALAPVLGDGILGVRAATMAFAAVGLTLGLLVVRRFTRHPGEFLVCTGILALWMFPRHKLYEPAMAMAVLWFAVRLIESPSAARHFAAGALSGFSTLIGRNHALYSGLAFGLLWAFLAWRRPGDVWRRAGALALGVLAGLTPLLAMLAFVPGFASGFAHSMRLILAHGSNLPLPYPFPWRTDWGALAGWRLASGVALATAFMLPFVLVPAGLVLALRSAPERLAQLAVPIAATVVGALYMHHAAVRSDAVHLGQCIQPLLILLLALPGLLAWRRLRTFSWATLVLLTLLACVQANSVLARRFRSSGLQLAPYSAAGEELQLPITQVLELEAIESFVRRNIPDSEPLWIVNRPGLYALLGRTAPTWWLTFYYEANEAEQRELIDDIDGQGVDWVLVAGDIQRFVKTHPLVIKHLGREFQPVGQHNLPPNSRLFRRRG